MVARHHAVQNLDPGLFSDLCDDRPYSTLQLAPQHPVAILRDPDQVIAVVVERMTSLGVAFHLRNLHSDRGTSPASSEAAREASPVSKTGV